MPTARPFAYNTGSLIPGTEQVGNIAVGYPTDGFGSTGLDWWNGPDEDPGYVICIPVPSSTQPTQVPEDVITLSGTYKGPNINLSNNNQTAFQQFGYQMSGLSETLISGTDKIMFSIYYTTLTPTTLPQSRFIGVGKTTMNYQGSPYGGYPGNDDKSIGFNAIGEYYYNGSVVSSDLPTWGDGDTIDIVISHGQYWWIRVNGGNWNNNPSANPTTLSGGMTMNGLTEYYPTLCPGYEGTMTILNYPPYGTPSLYNFLGNKTASLGFSITDGKTDNAFIDLTNSVSGQSFNNTDDCTTWLSTNGYWTSWTGVGTTTTTTTAATTTTTTTAATTTTTTTMTPPSGDYIITLTEVGSNVVMAGSGTLNIDGLTLVAGATGPMGGAGLGINSATFILGANGGYFDQYSGILTYPSNFGTGGGAGSSTSAGDIVGVIYDGGPPHLLIVPTGYTSGSYLTSSQTFNSQTFTSLGLVAGTYSYTWGTGSNAEILSVVVGGTASGGGGGGSTGSGSWYFYAAEGELIDGPPTTDGQAIFTDNLPEGSTNVTFNPNKSGGVNFLNFNLQDSTGTDYTTQFTNLQTNGGTVSVIQNGIIATYTLTAGMAFIQNPPGFAAINTGAATQTVTATSNFVYADPISIVFS